MTANDYNDLLAKYGWTPPPPYPRPPHPDDPPPTWEPDDPGDPTPYLYSHCWSRPRELDAERFASWSRDVRTILDNLPICGGRGPDLKRSSRRRGKLLGARFCGCDEREEVRLPGVLDRSDPSPLGHMRPVLRQPVVTSDLVLFCGWGLGDDLGFYIPQRLDDLEWKWQVETAHRPQRTRHGWAVDCCRCTCLLYEVAVTAALVRLAFHFPESCAIGGVIDPLDPFPPAWDTDDWEGGVELCQRLFGVGALPFGEPRPVIDAPTTIRPHEVNLVLSPGLYTGEARLQRGYYSFVEHGFAGLNYP